MIGLAGSFLTDVSLDEAGILTLRIGSGWLLSVENDYELSKPSGRRRTAEAEEEAIIASLTSQVGNALESFHVTPQGGVSVGVGGDVLYVAASPDFESWTLTGPDQQLVVSMPGGELATWGMRGGNPDSPDRRRRRG